MNQAKSSEDTLLLYLMNRYHLGFYSHVNIEHSTYGKQKFKHACLSNMYR